MRSIIISQPKSGTYLCANLLQNFGLDFTWMHISLEHYHQYDKNDIETCRLNALKFQVEEEFDSSIQKIGDNQFAVGHILYSHKTEHLLRDFKKVVLYRDNDEAFESFQNFRNETKKYQPGKRPYKSEQILKWKISQNVFILKFDDMINCNVDVLNELQIFLFDEIKYDSLSCMEMSMKQNSITKSEKRKSKLFT